MSGEVAFWSPPEASPASGRLRDQLPECRRILRFNAGFRGPFRDHFNPAEGALRPIVTDWKNWLSAGADTGVETLARATTFIETAKLSNLDPLACIDDILDPIHEHKTSRLDEFLPRN
ncbi:transposase IS66 family protein [Thioclava atlantica]|uniref:Transposase IS66 family protein n=1 Tax=Thioclava atlantica TaxID=1317124 RepID=A0A085TSZ6_9RHOB|nr:transposase IS66 family protein [Thioclava atlantica]